ncbi:hypothetical protein KY343_00690 [Candidatus Woesearchaeota archaeon]|nr:hypothetical protein [Candidatus Woesearchaeota archaeon]
MKKKAMSTGAIITIILVLAVVVSIFIISIGPIFELFSPLKTAVGEKCKETGIKMDEYNLEIENLIKDFDMNAADREEKEKNIVKLYKEFIGCFPDNNLEAYMEGVEEPEVFKFIFVLNEQKYYDKTVVNIAKRYLRRFPGMHTAEVNQYINAA